MSLGDLSQEDFKSGFIALIGRPNVGKSTFINKFIGEKIAITSPIAQTTRNRLKVILTNEKSQIIFVDTPGIHKPHHLLGCGLPQEFSLYSGSEFDWIESLDTSNPVIHGLSFVRYNEYGLDNKQSYKLADKIDVNVSNVQREIILENVLKFRAYVNG